MGHILHPSEVDYYISTFKTSKLEEIGSLGWFGKHKRLLQLHQQSILEVNESMVESVKELTAFHKKIINLVEEAISMSIWREKVLKELLKLEELQQECSFFVYVIMFHETTALGLLQNILYHQDAAAELGDFALELVDYCVTNMIRLTTNDGCQDKEELSLTENLRNKEKAISFDIGTRSVSVIRFLIETLPDLPLSVTTRIYEKHDVPLLLCQLVNISPWTRTEEGSGKVHKYVDSKWRVTTAGDRFVVTVTEGQVWLALRHLLLDERCQAHYQIDECRRNHLLKLQSHLTEPVLDQISPLVELKYFLSRLEMMDPSSQPVNSKKPFILEVITEFRSTLAEKTKKYFRKLAKNQIEVFAAMIQDGGAVDLAKDLASAYETLDLVDAEPARCGNCGEAAKRFCSRCKLEYYCGRECQVKAWPKHKQVCEIYGERSK